MSFPTGWTKKCSLTIDNTKVSGTSDLTNFPVLLTEANFPSTIFDNTQSAGQDLRFTSDEAGTTELAFEIVNWDTTNDKAEVWVKVPTVDYNNDTVFYVWYGNAAATAYAVDAAYGSQAVWADYEGVWHLTNADDSSANGYDLTASASAPTSTSGLIGTATTGAYSFVFANTQKLYITEANCTNLNISGNKAISLWFYGVSDQQGMPAGKSNAGATGGFYGLWTLILSAAENKCAFNTSSGFAPSPNNSAYKNNLYHLCGVIDATNSKVRFYLNGSKYETTLTKANTGDGDFAIGNLGGFSGWNAYFDGYVDETRVTASVLSDGWIATEYNNQNAPATFVTEGTEESVGATGISASKRSINC